MDESPHQAPQASLFRFTIRDLLWLTVVVALTVGWWRNYQMLEASHRERAKDALAHKRDLAREVQRYEDLWQTVNDPIRSSVDPFRGLPEIPRRRQFPAEIP